jgi:hypothetical protein
MKRTLYAVLFGTVGLIVGYLAGVQYFCSGENPGDLCGLPAAFITGPVAAALGVTLALKRSESRR